MADWSLTGKQKRTCLKNTDVLVDGRFEEDLKDTALKWRGSSNQQVIDVKRSLDQMKKVLYIR